MPASSVRCGFHWQPLKGRKQEKSQLPHGKGIVCILCRASFVFGVAGIRRLRPAQAGVLALFFRKPLFFSHTFCLGQRK